MAQVQALRLPPLPSVRDLVKLYKLRAIKQLSQNFLMDERLTDKIVRCAGNIRNHHVCEVGPGPGSITRSILKRQPQKLIVVEKDPRFLPSLELLQECCKTRTDFHIEIGDIMSFNLEKVFETAPSMDWMHSMPPLHLIGNLPFSISTALTIKWLQLISEKSSVWTHGRTPMTLTFQKEVGERMIAPPRHEQRCRLSVMCQLWCEVNYKFTISGKAFVPKPDVDVAVVTLVPLKKPLVDLPFKFVERVVRTVFNTRQKSYVKGVARLFPECVRDELTQKVVVLTEIEPHNRPFELTNAHFVRLCYSYKLLCDEYPLLEGYDFRMSKLELESYMKKFQESVDRIKGL